MPPRVLARCLLPLFTLIPFTALTQITPPRMPRTPDIHGDTVVFSAEGDLWLGSLKGGTAERITTDPGVEMHPRFSPDGKWIAFTGSYDGGTDVYVMPTEGGAPRRLTYDPVSAEMVSWTPDGKQILFRSRRSSAMGPTRLYLVSAEGGLPKPLPMEKGAQGSYSPDGSKLAYVRLPLETHHWKRYHGGEADQVWIGDMANLKFHRIDDDTVNEQYPTWIGNAIYYVSERDGTANLWRYDTETGSQKRVTSRDTYDVLSPSTDGKRIIYEWGNDLWVYDTATGREEQVKLSLSSDMIHARPHVVQGSLEDITLGPTGKRVAILGRGQMFTVPTESGDIREVANKSGTRSKDPAWSPDGKWIAFISDRSGNENMWLAPASGDGEPKQITQSEKMPLDGPTWSPDSKLIAYRDFSQSLHLIDAEGKSDIKIDQSDWGDISDYAFSPDSKWIAYSKPEGLVVRSLYLYDVDNKRSTRLTFAPMIDTNPSFDPDGKFLYFVSGSRVEAVQDEMDFQVDFTQMSKLYAFALAKDTPSPLSLTNDEEPGSVPDVPVVAPPATPAKETVKPIKIDLGGLSDRIIELPTAKGSYGAVYAIPGKVMYVSSQGDGDRDLKCFTMKTKAETTLASHVNGYDVSADGKKMAVMAPALQIVDAGEPVTPGQGRVELGAWQIRVDPAAEWRQIFMQAWRQHRDQFYDPLLHGMDWEAVRKKYEALMPAVADRSELNEIIGNMQGEMNVSHEFVGGGYNRVSALPGPRIATLGADLEYDNSAKAYRVARIFKGDGFSQDSRSPLLTPGSVVNTGEYLLAINGTPLKADQDPYALLIGQAGHIVRLQVNARPTTDGARIVRVKALASEARARYYDWVGKARDYVTKNGGPNLAYIHVPDMETDGMQEFTKHFYANLDKDGMIIDVRYNHGGDTSGMILERLRRVIFEFDQPRYGAPQPYHRMGYLGYVVVLCNEQTSSDGEYFCTGFRYMKLGPTVGTRTWGGFMAVGGFPAIDGGMVSTPVEGSFTPEGKWLPDGTGFTPDYLVDDDPNSFVAGRDPQMDKALELLKEEIRRDPPKWPKRMLPPSKEKAFKANKG